MPPSVRTTASKLALAVDDDGDDDDDTNTATDGDNTDKNTFTGHSRATNDNTRSNFTKVSRDKDLSRGDKTKDWTRDGGSRTRDHSADRTNDKSRNDTRG